MFRKWLASQKVGKNCLSSMTVVKHMRNLSCMFGLNHGALKLDLVPFNPFDREKMVAKAPKKSHPDFTDKQIDDLLDACPSSAWRSLVGLCVLAGIRLGEWFAMTWQDVHWGEGKITLCRGVIEDTKKRERECRLEPKLEQILLEGFESGDTQPVPLSSNNLNRDMKVIIKRAGMTPWADPFHALRRWRDSTWKLQYPEYVVDAWLGHSLEVSREHYVSVPDHLYRPPGKLDRITGMIQELDDKQLDRLERIVAYLSKRNGATSAQQ